MIILAIDAATETGCADGAVGQDKPRLWTWSLRDAGDSRPRRLLMLHEFLGKYFSTVLCDAVVYESPMPIGAIASMRGMNDANLSLLRGAIGVIEVQCCRYGMPVQALSVQDARGAILGWRTNRRKKGTTKLRVMDDVRMLGIEANNDHEADAAVLWLYAWTSCSSIERRSLR
jgi:hypothetical protein